jgi:hypothetical protein
MGVPEEPRALVGELEASTAVLARISRFYDRFVRKPGSTEKNVESAIILSDVFVSFYTCLETPFLRISQYFENALDRRRWHRDVLKKMTLTIRGIRKRVVSDATFHDLDELLRFRHFKRYYFEFEYDWDRLEVVRKKYLSARRRAVQELEAYIDYLEGLARTAEDRE